MHNHYKEMYSSYKELQNNLRLVDTKCLQDAMTTQLQNNYKDAKGPQKDAKLSKRDAQQLQRNVQQLQRATKSYRMATKRCKTTTKDPQITK